MSHTEDFRPASINDECKARLCRLEEEMSGHNNKDIVLVAYEKK